MSYNCFLFLIIILSHSILCDEPCIYLETPGQNSDDAATTSNTYLDSISGTEAKKQKCFSLSYSNVFYKECCYKIDSDNNDQETCIEKPGDHNEALDGTDGVYCPIATKIPNNCGMAGVYQPVDSTICTEISLVNGYCCFVKTNNRGTFCGSRDEMDDDNKREVPDDVKEYVSDYINSIGKSEGDTTTIDSIICEGFYHKFYGLLLLMSTVILF